MNIFPLYIRKVDNGFMLYKECKPELTPYSKPDSGTYVFNTLDQMFDWIRENQSGSGTFEPNIK